MHAMPAAAFAACLALAGCAAGTTAPSRLGTTSSLVGLTSATSISLPSQRVLLRGSATLAGVVVTPAVTLQTDTSGGITSARVVLPELATDVTFLSGDFTQSAIRSGSTLTRSTATAAIGADTLTFSLITPSTSQLQYHSLGNWVTVISGTTTEGYMSMGYVTAGSDVPTTGTATYSGVMTATAKLSGTLLGVDALAAATVDFTARSLVLSTSGTERYDFSTPGTRTADATMDLSGTLTWSSGLSNFSGTVSSGSGMTGNANGHFFGPSAAELGGTLRMDSATDHMVGGFALKRN